MKSKFFAKLNYPVMLLAFVIGFMYIQSSPAAKTIVIKTPNKNNLDTIYSDEHDNSIKYQFEQKQVKCN